MMEVTSSEKEKAAVPEKPSMTTEEMYSIRDHWKCLAACTLVSMCPFQYGLDFGLIGGLQAMIGFLKVFGHENPNVPSGWNIEPGRQRLISSLMILGAFISSAAAGPIAMFVSRKQVIWIASVLYMVSNVVMMATTNIGGLYAGRLLIGIANGLFMTFSQLYIQETTPARYRGLMISSFQVWTSIGSLLGTVVDNFTAEIEGKASYLIPLGIIYAVPILISFGILFIPESPRWLLQHGHTEKAYKALHWLRPFTEAQVEAEVREINDGLARENEIHQNSSIMDMFTNPVDRRRTILAVCALSVQGASGAMYVISYGTYFFRMAGITDAFQNACILTGIGVVAILINSAIITKFGRRRVFLISGLIVCGVSQLIIAVIYTVKPGTIPTGRAIVGFSIIYIVGYNGAIAAYAWVSGGELPSQRLRSYTFGLATSVGFLCAWLATFTAPYFINPESLNWGPKYGYIWTPSCFLAAAWVYFFLPEVKGRTLEEIDEMFEARLPAKKFRTYVCDRRNPVADSSDKDSKSVEVAQAENVVWSDGKMPAEVATAIA